MNLLLSNATLDACLFKDAIILVQVAVDYPSGCCAKVDKVQMLCVEALKFPGGANCITALTLRRLWRKSLVVQRIALWLKFAHGTVSQRILLSLTNIRHWPKW
jgi:hypothetical protein